MKEKGPGGRQVKRQVRLLSIPCPNVRTPTHASYLLKLVFSTTIAHEPMVSSYTREA